MTFQYVRRRKHIPASGNPFKNEYTLKGDTYCVKNSGRYWYPQTAGCIYEIVGKKTTITGYMTLEVTAVAALKPARESIVGQTYEISISNATQLCREGTTDRLTIRDIKEIMDCL